MQTGNIIPATNVEGLLTGPGFTCGLSFLVNRERGQEKTLPRLPSSQSASAITTWSKRRRPKPPAGRFRRYVVSKCVAMCLHNRVSQTCTCRCRSARISLLDWAPGYHKPTAIPELTKYHLHWQTNNALSFQWFMGHTEPSCPDFKFFFFFKWMILKSISLLTIMQ